METAASSGKAAAQSQRLSVKEFVEKTRRLLELERKEEVEEISAAVNGLSEKVLWQRFIDE